MCHCSLDKAVPWRAHSQKSQHHFECQFQNCDVQTIEGLSNGSFDLIEMDSKDCKWPEALPKRWDKIAVPVAFSDDQPRSALERECTSATCATFASKLGMLTEANTLGQAQENWGDAPALDVAGSDFTFQETSSILDKPFLGTRWMLMECIFLAGCGNAELRRWKAFGVSTIFSKAKLGGRKPEHGVFADTRVLSYKREVDVLSSKVFVELKQKGRSRLFARRQPTWLRPSFKGKVE